MDVTVTAAIQIDVWSDIACPWCYIGKRNMEAGIRDFSAGADALPVDITYHSFQLASDTPVDFDGSEVDFLVSHKRMRVEQVRQLLDHVSAVARSVGLAYDFDAVQHTNTVKAHQLLHYAKGHGVQGEAKERLLRAYFVEGRHIGRDDHLADVAAEIGLDRDDVLRSLRTGKHLSDVQADERTARDYGIRGVPFFVIDRRYGISGAQPPELFTRALAQAAAGRDEAVAS